METNAQIRSKLAGNYVNTVYETHLQLSKNELTRVFAILKPSCSQETGEGNYTFMQG